MGLPKPILTEHEYLKFERAAPERHIYVDGEIFAMAGESPEHGDITANVLASLHRQLDDSPCRVRVANTKVRSGPMPKSPRRPAGLYSYPDIVVICGEPEYVDDYQDVVLNPKVIVEALSDSTEAFDRGDKFARYQKYNPTLTDYILISQDRPQIDHFRREKDGSWKYTIYEGLKSVVKIDSLKCRLKAAEVYKRVKFASEEE
ncbi:MAG: Uma2 family endonuclease [Planctomycetes bacterium]|nr:Uma2 family endonuclease [Planctomycetota bacterium]